MLSQKNFTPIRCKALMLSSFLTFFSEHSLFQKISSDRKKSKDNKILKDNQEWAFTSESASFAMAVRKISIWIEVTNIYGGSGSIPLYNSSKNDQSNDSSPSFDINIFLHILIIQFQWTPIWTPRTTSVRLENMSCIPLSEWLPSRARFGKSTREMKIPVMITIAIEMSKSKFST